MISTSRTTHRTAGRAGMIAAGAIAAAGFTLAAPQSAEAAVTQVAATPDMSVGVATNYGTGCNYTLRAVVDDPSAPVTFFDNGAPIGRIRPSGATALTQWVPATQGSHTLTAVQDGQPAERPVANLVLPVGTGAHLGYSCAVFGG
ncbi:hypothetical protein BJY24_007605 [Nocardia transvalensis]|uniref:Ig-like domain-containing protein n=1 Tax=Nocardia transvalensis TaxID=37333 RepID=A0A7W9UMJ7_9NOCA|nr:hypothetical protein [Nocardia transvalensis]MBB5918693.1 hypothetical protein [Nocardia transvalensis]